jgi:hypothetical protein
MTPQVFCDGSAGFSAVVLQRSMADAYSMALDELLARPESQAASALSTLPSQSSSTVFASTSKAPGLTSSGLPQPSACVSQQSPWHLV